MIKTLILKNLILVEDALIPFEKGLTMITGETGAGKTALIEAIRLILGERADSSKVRKGCEKAVVQAAFELDLTPAIKALFEEAGLSLSLDEELLVTREITAAGKSRAFICGQMVSATFLQSIAPYLVDFVSQHSQAALRSSEMQRDLLDHYIEIDLLPFQKHWEQEKELQSQIASLEERKTTGDQRQIFLEAQLEELQEANLKEGEEEILFEEYQLLANSQELLAASDQILAETESAVEKCVSISSILGTILKYNPKLEESQKMAREAQLQLNEISSELSHFQSKIESDPNRLAFIEGRLKLLGSLKKKHGQNLWAIQENIERELQHLETLDETIQNLQSQLQKAKHQTELACQELSKKRKTWAIELSKRLSDALQKLNIPSAKVSIRVDSANRTKTGEDGVSFLLQANIGEQPTLVKESASGGEISRLYFSLKMILAEKTAPSTMVFDEIDANVGGETARIMGEQLKELGKMGQILCITHFPQVASQGDQHIRVYKEEKQGRTVSQIDSIGQREKEEELLRMLGIAQK